MKSFNVFEATFEYDAEDPEGYRSGMHRFGPDVGGAPGMPPVDGLLPLVVGAPGPGVLGFPGLPGGVSPPPPMLGGIVSDGPV